MGRKSIVLTPDITKKLKIMGEQIKLARLRRDISTELVAQRASVSRTVVWKVEKGSPSVSIGIYASILHAIGLDSDLLLIAKDDERGRLIQDLNLKTRKRASKGD